MSFWVGGWSKKVCYSAIIQKWCSSKRNCSTRMCPQSSYLVPSSFLSSCTSYLPYDIDTWVPCILPPWSYHRHLLWCCASSFAGPEPIEPCIKRNVSFKLFFFFSSICHTMKCLTNTQRTLIFSPQQYFLENEIIHN